MMPSTPSAPSDPGLWSPVPQRPDIEATVGLGADPDALQAALDELDVTLRLRVERRRAATRKLVAELYARDGVEPSPERLDAETEAACAQEREERLAAELRRLVIPDPAAARQARTLSDKDLDDWCQAALNVLGDAPPSFMEFQPEAEQRHAADRAVLDGYVTKEAHTASLLEQARGWQLRRRRGLRDKLAEAGRGRQAAEHRLRLAAAKLAAVQARGAQRAEWLAQPRVRSVLGEGAAALRELLDRAQVLVLDATAELPAVDRPFPGTASRPVTREAAR